MNKNPWGQELVEERKHVDIINFYANEELTGGYGDIETSKETLLISHPEARDNVLTGFGVVYHSTGMCPDSSADWYDTIEEARTYADELEKEIDEEKLERSSRLSPRSSELRETLYPKPVQGTIHQYLRSPLMAGELAKTLQNTPESYTVGIEISDEGISEGALVGIELAYAGFDWTMGNLVIKPTKPLIRKESALELSDSELKALKEALEELRIYRQTDEDPREFTTNGLYQDEISLAKKLGLEGI